MTSGSVEKTGLYGWWRWPLLPFAAFAGAMAGSAAFMLLQWVSMKMQGGYSEDGWFFLYIVPLMQSAMFGYLYALISCHVAPYGKFIAGVVMVTILVGGLLLLLALMWIKLEFSKELIQPTLAVIAISITSVSTLVSLRDEL